MRVCVIQVPYHAGDERHGASHGPRRYVEAGLEQMLTDRRLTVRMDRVERVGPFRDTVTASLAVCCELARAVQAAVAAGELPLVLAGGCDASKGVLSGFDHGSCGVVWFDAHGDFNTPDSTITGYFPGMSMAVITGHCYRNAWARIGNAEPVPEASTLMLGVRALDPAERDRLERSAIRVVPWQDGVPRSDVHTGLEELRTRVDEIYLHIDIDSLDPEFAPGVVDEPVPGGLSLEQMTEVLGAVAARFRIRAVTLAVYNPDRDAADRTLHSGLRIIDRLAEGLAATTKV